TVKIDNRPFYAKKRNIFLVTGVLAGLLIGTFGSGSFTKSVSDRSIAVLPFSNYSTLPEDQYFSDGITEVIIANLAKVGGLKVISRTSVMEYKGTTKKIKEIAKELGVTHILEGSIQKANGRIRVVGQLIDTKKDEHLWAETYDRKETDIFDVQSDVALKIAEVMRGKLSEEAEKLIKVKPTDNIEAYDYYLQAQKYADRRTQEDLSLAIIMLEKSIELDNNFALAYARQGYFILLKEFLKNGKVGEKLLTRAKEKIELALQIAPENPSVRASFGFYHYYGFRDYRKALKDFEFALEKEPGNSKHLFDMGSLYRRLGEWEKNIEYYSRAYAIDPNSISYAQNLQQSYMLVRQFEKAEEIADEMINRHPDRSTGYARKINVLLARNADVDAAKIIMEKAKLMTKEDLLQLQLDLSLYKNDYSSFISILENDTTEYFIRQWNYQPRFFLLGMGYEFIGEKDISIKYYTKALKMVEDKFADMPTDPRINLQLGLIYGKLNRKREALRFGKIGSSLLPVSRDHLMGAHLFRQLILIQVYVNDFDLALDNLEYLSSISSVISYGDLVGDPNWNPIRDNPRFKKLLTDLQ
ncbi:uncharacterized protein METZ01_LOCUS194566, partial [marine metagenome]